MAISLWKGSQRGGKDTVKSLWRGAKEKSSALQALEQHSLISSEAQI